MAYCDDTPVILDIFLWERPENQTIFSIFTGRILVMMNATLVWDGNLHTAMAHSWMRPSQIIHTSVGAIGEINTPEKKDDRDWTKVIVDQIILSEGRESSFKYCHGPYIDIDIAFQQPWGNALALIWWFHTIGAQCRMQQLDPKRSLFELTSGWQPPALSQDDLKCPVGAGNRTEWKWYLFLWLASLSLKASTK